ncbi:MAG TPA: glycoside hydrolase family 3 N-terminal domain-containing protein, partial [Gammaproteobacteria bacterium]|nr:glycoside hydrolase family 3 N-terminal domain-containing protein [Gammaproteobacteria bacterium]
KNLINKGLRGIMTAHIKYPLVDKKLATFSKFWLIEYLQKELQFNGIIFSDDLMMKSTDFLSSTMQKVNASLEAGCDFVLICNSMQAVSECLSKLHFSGEQFTNLEKKSSSLRPLLNNSYDTESNLVESKTKLDLVQNSL